MHVSQSVRIYCKLKYRDEKGTSHDGNDASPGPYLGDIRIITMTYHVHYDLYYSHVKSCRYDCD